MFFVRAIHESSVSKFGVDLAGGGERPYGVVGNFFVCGCDDVHIILKKEHIFKRKLRSNSFTPIPSGVGVNEVLCAAFFQESAYSFPRKRVILLHNEKKPYEKNIRLIFHRLLPK